MLHSEKMSGRKAKSFHRATADYPVESDSLPRPEIVAVGGASIDYLARATRLPESGASVDGDMFLAAPGGKGANVAVAIARLGGRASLVARVGYDSEGGTALKTLQAEGVDTRFVVADPAAPTGATVVQVGGAGEKQTISRPGANAHLTREDIRAASSVVGTAQALVVQLEVPVDVVLEAVRIAHNAGAYVVLDPAPPQKLPDEIFHLTDAVSLNAGEAKAITGHVVDGIEGARRAAHWFIERDVGAVAVQAADEGKLLVWHGGECMLPKLPVRVVDTTGAGDAFAAALALCLAQGYPLAHAGTFANAASALAATALGAQTALGSAQAVRELLRSHSEK